MNDTPSRVFMSSEPTRTNMDRDFSSAQRYGRIEFLLPSRPSPSVAPGPAMIKLQKALADYRPDKDYIAFGGGDPAALLLIGAALAHHGHRHFTFLRWERERSPDGARTGGGFYLPSKMPLLIA